MSDPSDSGPSSADAAPYVLSALIDQRLAATLRRRSYSDFISNIEGILDEIGIAPLPIPIETPMFDFELSLLRNDVEYYGPPEVPEEGRWVIQLAGDPKLDLQNAPAIRHGAAAVRDLPIAPSDSWCPSEAPSPVFGTTQDALAQIGAGNAASADGSGVVVVIVDQGINKEVLQARHPGARFGGGWSVCDRRGTLPCANADWIRPGTWPDGHGTKMAELVLSVAPKATILDLPLLPDRIDDLRSYLSWATWMYWSLTWTIPLAKLKPEFSGPWVLCNAWSVYNLSGDSPTTSPFNYGQNPNNIFNRGVAELPRAGLADVIFAAGNCGQFCPDDRCGAMQIGPGRSIYGAAALLEVLTVGAVRNDEIWLGFSSQGPSPPGYGSEKPDLVAPSQFADPLDAARQYGGTSAACALAAGAIAAARSTPILGRLTPAQLKARVLATARDPVAGAGDTLRIGAGLLDLEALLATSAATTPVPP